MSDETYNCEPHALDYPVDNLEKLESEDLENALREGAVAVAEVAALSHEKSVIDAAHELIFSGDTFGISYRDFDVDDREFIFPTTTPVHFDPEALCHSVDRLMSYAPRSIYLTHYGEVRDLRRLAPHLPGTAFYAGYNDDFNYRGFNPYSGLPEQGLRSNGRTFFIKMSYLFRRSF